MSDFTKRLTQLLQTVNDTEDWTVLSVEDAVAITVAGIVFSQASDKWPDLYSDVYHAVLERSK